MGGINGRVSIGNLKFPCLSAGKGLEIHSNEAVEKMNYDKKDYTV